MSQTLINNPNGKKTSQLSIINNINMDDCKVLNELWQKLLFDLIVRSYKNLVVILRIILICNEKKSQ